jgi:UDPglucose--hexose-1-phosphate uridylyltransferase
MAKFVPDVKTTRWIVISQVRWTRPEDFENKPAKSRVCPFCPGNEKETTSEIFRIGDGEKDQTGWHIRVIPNKYPITDIHEVIIHSPDHNKNIEDFDVSHVNHLLSIFRTRYQAHAEDGQVMIFSNFGENAGASLVHPHSQLVVIPRQINLDALVRQPVMNVVDDNNFFITYCPDFSQWPYELWIAPKKESTLTFADVNDDQLQDLSVIFQTAFKRLKILYQSQAIQSVYHGVPFAYNFYIHHGKNWFIRIIPRLVHRAGFELGTGLNVNVVDPTDAAVELKKIKIG